MMTIKTYSELVALPTFQERFNYLKLAGKVGEATFGFERYLNQKFYHSREWRRIRDQVIVRDNGCDLGVEGRDIFGRIIIHHMNPISMKDLETKSRFLLDPEYLICITHETHNALHYSDESLLATLPIERIKNDTCPWKH